MIIGLIVKASLLMGVAAAGQALLGRRASAAARHLTLACAMAALLVLPLLSAVLPGWNAIRLPEAVRHLVTAERPLGNRGAATQGPDESASADRGHSATEGRPRESAVGDVRDSAPRLTASWSAVLWSMYAAGVLLIGARLVTDAWMMRRSARSASAVDESAWIALFDECAACMGVRRHVKFLRGREYAMPLAFGIRRPAILIPAIGDTWTDDRRRAVLLHELAHVSRRDCATELVSSIVRMMYWWHPGVWWMARRVRLERELACDDRVLAAGARPRDYAGHLLELAYALGDRQAPALAVGMARPRQLERRLAALLEDSPRRNGLSWRVVVAGGAAALALLLPIASARAVVADSPAPVARATEPATVVENRAASPMVDAKPSRRSGAIVPARRIPTLQAPVPAQAIAHTVSRRDTLAITVTRFPQLSGQYTVNDDGTIRFPLLGHVAVASRTTRDVATDLEARLRDGYIRAPEVAVELVFNQLDGPRVYVFGRGGSPGAYLLNADETIVDLLRRTGYGSASEAIVIRQAQPAAPGAPLLPANPDIIRVNLREVEIGFVFELRDGDSIYTAPTNVIRVFVTGQVVRPGRFDLSENATVRVAIEAAGGFIDSAPPAVIHIVRFISGERKVFDVSLDDRIYLGDTIVAGSDRR